MDEFKKDTNLLNGKGEVENVSWITINGAHIPIKDGETRETAIRHFIEKNKSAQRNKSNKVLSLEEQVDSVLKGTYKDHHIMLCEKTPKVLQDLAIPDKPLLMTAKHAYLAINESGKYVNPQDHYHGLGKELFMLLPKLLETPMMVLENKKYDSEIVVVLSWFDKNKNILIMPIKVNGKGNFNYVEVDSNIAKSVYGRENFTDYINSHFTQDDILFAGNKKIRDLTLKR